MKICVVAVGRNHTKKKEQDFRNAEAEYLKRLGAFADVKVMEVKDEIAVPTVVGGALSRNAFWVGFDERGESLSSPEFAYDVLQKNQDIAKSIAVVIGGPDGHSDELRNRFDAVLSFGRLTIPHRLVRVLVLEQLYRGFSIIAKHPYHR